MSGTVLVKVKMIINVMVFPLISICISSESANEYTLGKGILFYSSV